MTKVQIPKRVVYINKTAREMTCSMLPDQGLLFVRYLCANTRCPAGRWTEQDKIIPVWADSFDFAKYNDYNIILPSI